MNVTVKNSSCLGYEGKAGVKRYSVNCQNKPVNNHSNLELSRRPLH